MRFNIILNIGGHMYQIKKVFNTRAGILLALVLFVFVFYLPVQSQSKYNLQITGGYAITDLHPDNNGYNFDISFNRNIWSVISAGVYVDYANTDNLIPEVNGNGTLYGGDFIPYALDTYIRSLTWSDVSGFSQDMANFLSYGMKVNFDFKIFKRFKMGFGLGLGATTRKSASMILSYAHFGANGTVDNYKIATVFLKTTEFSWRYDFNFTYNFSERIKAILQLGHNASKYEKHPTGFTSYVKANIGIAIIL